MTDFLFGRVAQALAAVPEDVVGAMRALDGSETDRIDARRRYEEFSDGPLSPVRRVAD